MVCVDPWTAYIDLSMNNNLVHRAMAKATRKNVILRLFQHNIRAAGHADIVAAFQGSSGRCLPILKDETFDLIYVDGDHSYEAVLQDLDQAGRLVKSGGIICGDDLELQRDVVDRNTVEAKRNSDFEADQKTGVYFHPGVTLAVWQFFGGKVSCWEGFWAMRKAEKGWEKVDMEGSYTRRSSTAGR